MQKKLKLINLLNIVLLAALIGSSALSIYFKELPYLDLTSKERSLSILGFALFNIVAFLIGLWLTYRLSLAKPFSKIKIMHPWLATGMLLFFILAPLANTLMIFLF